MKTVGETLKEARVKKRYSKKKIAKITKIKEEFVEAIEGQNWDKLPEFAVVQGFVKSIAHALGLADKQAVALLRRDYPPKEVSVNPKPDVGEKFRWSPKTTFLLGVGMIILFVLSYLGFEYFKFISPPRLEVIKPEENMQVENDVVNVEGKTDADATIKINNQPVIVEEDGTFSAEIEISQNTEEIVVIAVSRSGKETYVRRNIEPKVSE